MPTQRSLTRRPLAQLAGAALLGVALSAPNVHAQTVDLIPEQPILVQAIQTGTTELFGDRTTFVRVPVTLVDAAGPVPVDGLLHVYADGAEIPGSPFFSDNGPFEAGAFGSLAAENFTLNFTIVPPTTEALVLEVVLNPPGPNFVEEANTANNVLTTPAIELRRLSTVVLAYAPVDYRPSGGPTPNPPDPDLIKPGVGDNFVQGVFPGGRIEYRRIDAPTKLWTQSVAGSGTALNNSLASDLALMSPQPNFIYGWIPGSIPYNGQALLPGVASMGNTQTIRHQRTYAHELGHNTNLFHNGSSVGSVGVDVERHLAITENLPKIKASGLNDVMVAGQLTNTAWIAPSSYNNFINHPAWDPSDSDAAPGGDGTRLIVSGMWNRETGTIDVDPVVEVAGGRLTPPGAPGARDLVIRGMVQGQTARELPLTVRTSLDECEACRTTVDGEGDGDTDSHAPSHPVVGFVAVLPSTTAAGVPLDALRISGLGTHPAQAVTLARSDAAPEVAFTTPAAELVVGDTLTLNWEGSDADGDALAYVLRYVPDGEQHFVPLLDRSDATSFTVDFARLPHFVAGKGYFELLATDGLNTTRTRTEALQGVGAYAGAVGGNPPFVEIYHPDNGFRFAQGANVVLHCSGWDLEDFALDGTSISWSSDVDGFLGNGRRFTVNDLSVGAHAITVTGTDSGGLMTSRTNSVVILPRALPDTGRVVCSSDIGFGGPGDSVLTLCGGDLTAGGTAELLLTGAPANTSAWLAVGLDANPVAFKGGMFVPFPYTSLLPRMTDGNGEVSNPNVTGGMPLTFFLQYVIVDGAQPAGFGLSNALFVEF